MPLRGLSGFGATLFVAGRRVSPATMNKQLTICSPGTVNSTDGTTGPPLPEIETWGAIFALSGDELDRAQQIAQRASHVVVIPYALGIPEAGVVQYIDGGLTRTFQIEAIVDEDEQRWMLKIYCFEINQNAGQAS